MVQKSKKSVLRKSIFGTSEAHQNFQLIPKWLKFWILSLYLHLKRLRLGPVQNQILVLYLMPLSLPPFSFASIIATRFIFLFSGFNECYSFFFRGGFQKVAKTCLQTVKLPTLNTKDLIFANAFSFFEVVQYTFIFFHFHSVSKTTTLKS